MGVGVGVGVAADGVGTAATTGDGAAADCCGATPTFGEDACGGASNPLFAIAVRLGEGTRGGEPTGKPTPGPWSKSWSNVVKLGKNTTTESPALLSQSVMKMVSLKMVPSVTMMGMVERRGEVMTEDESCGNWFAWWRRGGGGVLSKCVCMCVAVLLGGDGHVNIGVHVESYSMYICIDTQKESKQATHRCKWGCDVG